MDNYAYIALFAVVGVGFTIATMLLSWAVRPGYKPVGIKAEPYECGEVPMGNAWKQFRVGYYLFALVFVVFDVESIFLFPWAKELRHLKAMGLGLFALTEMIVFILILVVGLVYAWRKGALRWE